MERYSNWYEFKEMCKDIEEKIYGYIYLFVNLWNNHMYVGQTIDLRTRLDNHIGNYQNQLVDRAIEKWTPNNFEFLIIDCAFSKEELDEREVYWIGYYNTFRGEGYNLTSGGSSGERTKGGEHWRSDTFTVTNLNTGKKITFGSTFECDRESEKLLGIRISQPLAWMILQGWRKHANPNYPNYGEKALTYQDHIYRVILDDELIEYKFNYKDVLIQEKVDTYIYEHYDEFTIPNKYVFKVTNNHTGEEFKYLSLPDFEERSEKTLGMRISKQKAKDILLGNLKHTDQRKYLDHFTFTKII